MFKMIWNHNAAENSFKTASACHGNHSLPRGLYIKRPSFFSCGENIHVSQRKEPWRKVVGEWERENRIFVYGKGGNHKDVGHYTQMVWANSYLLGCALVKCENRDLILFYCQYCPA
ncbi:hypothetical protein GDO81_027460 [Engystomops pustulosus]|uniref:SCP domain-containing protein n=2 Tax=Engystomops pustulosus TaxID=76066 RepID=A0AAV6ZEZ4_ENGPU|nr:hypothetical protein GDO81_027460 [Engystomops pustulosus]